MIWGLVDPAWSDPGYSTRQPGGSPIARATTEACDEADPPALALYAISFLADLAIGMSLLALPFAAMELGAGPALVGLLGGMYTLTYATGCLLAIPLIDHVRPKVAVVAANIVLAGVSLGMALTGRLSVLIALVAVLGAMMLALWPPLMSWIAHVQEGPVLNRRLGRFNVAWCAGLTIGPFLGGSLFELNPYVPFAAAAALHLIVALLAAASRAPHIPHTREELDARASPPRDRPADLFRLMARVALGFGYLSMGIQRFQLAALARHLGIREAVFGAVMFVLSLSMASTFLILGRTHRWHYRAGCLWGAQLLLAAATTALVWADHPYELGLVAAVTGACVGVLYSSSLYYGATGRGKRTGRMAIHEMLLSAGMLIGSVGGGKLSEAYTLRTPYPLCAALILVGVVLQMAIYAAAGGAPSPVLRSREPQTAQEGESPTEIP